MSVRQGSADPAEHVEEGDLPVTRGRADARRLGQVARGDDETTPRR